MKKLMIKRTRQFKPWKTIGEEYGETIFGVIVTIVGIIWGFGLIIWIGRRVGIEEHLAKLNPDSWWETYAVISAWSFLASLIGVILILLFFLFKSMYMAVTEPFPDVRVKQTADGYERVNDEN